MTVHWIDRLEKLGRLLLWLTLASAVVLVPVAYIRQRSAEYQTTESMRLEELRKAGASSVRLPWASMGPAIQALNVATATGRVWFSNVSPRTGVVCIAGTATNPNTRATTESLPACQQVAAYATTVEMKVMFAGGDLLGMCKDVSCSFSVKEIPDAAAP